MKIIMMIVIMIIIEMLSFPPKMCFPLAIEVKEVGVDPGCFAIP